MSSNLFWLFGTVFLALAFLCSCKTYVELIRDSFEDYEKYYGSFPESKRLEKLTEAQQMFYFGYDNYMKYAFPQDELDPIHCTGRGPDYENP